MSQHKVHIQSLKNRAGIKIFKITGESGDLLDQHKVNQNAILWVQSGNIIYKQDDLTQLLSHGDHHDIPADVIHRVQCTTKAQFLVIMPDKTQMSFV